VACAAVPAAPAPGLALLALLLLAVGAHLARQRRLT
jgi:MYXO-CTERM domain-containing protein